MSLQITNKTGDTVLTTINIAPRLSADQTGLQVFGGIQIRSTTADGNGILTVSNDVNRILIPDVEAAALTDPDLATLATSIFSALQTYVTAKGI